MRNPEEYRVSFTRKKGSHLKVVQHTVNTGNELLNSIVNQTPSQTDPYGSYTGVPVNEFEVPVQDADDL